MSVSLTAIALGQELQARGISSIGRLECEAIVASIIERISAVANEASARPRLALVMDTGTSAAATRRVNFPPEND
jgi:hypothetical protein